MLYAQEARHFAVIAATFSAILLGVVTPLQAGPYPPAAGQPGSTAVSKDDSAILAWATGFTNYLPGTDLTESWQTPEKALGAAVGDSLDIVGLGRGGQITLTFDAPIVDGPGADFAVFENGFADTFLELAWVEVSSDGVNFTRFANDSLTPDPVSSFGSIDPTNIDGFGGKYRQGFGTPFDLADLGLSIVSVVRIVDIIGDGFALDTTGDIIYDPFPTSGSAGFDLEALGVLNPVPGPATIVLMFTGALALARKRRQA